MTLPSLAITGRELIYELVGLFFQTYEKILDKKNIDFDRDDGLVIIKDKSAGLVDKTRKKLYKVFEQFGLKITGKVNSQVANFLDGPLDLTTGKHSLYRKPNDDLLHV